MKRGSNSDHFSASCRIFLPVLCTLCREKSWRYQVWVRIILIVTGIMLFVWFILPLGKLFAYSLTNVAGWTVCHYIKASVAGCTVHPYNRASGADYWPVSQMVWCILTTVPT